MLGFTLIHVGKRGPSQCVDRQRSSRWSVTNIRGSINVLGLLLWYNALEGYLQCNNYKSIYGKTSHTFAVVKLLCNTASKTVMAIKSQYSVQQVQIAGLDAWRWLREHEMNKLTRPVWLNNSLQYPHAWWQIYAYIFLYLMISIAILLNISLANTSDRRLLCHRSYRYISH